MLNYREVDDFSEDAVYIQDLIDVPISEIINSNNYKYSIVRGPLKNIGAWLYSKPNTSISLYAGRIEERNEYKGRRMMTWSHNGCGATWHKATPALVAHALLNLP